MNPIAYHVTFRLADDRVIATTPAAFRAAARCFLRHGRKVRLLAYCIVDTHAHALLVCDRDAAGRFAACVTLAMHRVLRLGAPFERSRIRPIVAQDHLYSTFWYVQNQHKHHRVTSDPFHEGSHLPDLCGLRVVDDAIEEAVRGHLPRLALRLPPSGPFALQHLADAAAAALALPDLSSRSTPSVLATAAAIQLATPHHDTREIVRALEVSRTTVKRLRGIAVPRQLLTAVERQVGWRSATEPALIAAE